MLSSHLTTHRFTQGDVLAVTRLRKDVLQTWMNRGVIALGDQNPGTGRRRLYSPLDIVKLALMRRVADLGMALSIGLDLAGEAERVLLAGRLPSWNEHLSMKPDAATRKEASVSVIASAGYSLLALKYGATVGDAFEMRVSSFTEPFDGVFQRRKRTGDEERPIDPDQRAALARKGIHAEPVVIFPFGEIVNATLLQVEDLIAATAGPRAPPPVDPGG